MISKRRFSLPRLDITGMWVFSLGVWFHIVARLVYSKPWMAFFLAELIAAILVLFGAKWHLNRSQFGIRIDHDLASISDHSLASQSITIWHASDH
ncbi:type-F conjugative transfer system pilin chaperone TraQ [Escherichia coli]|uniref:type-F conjugative transfer system pilin chaperone TraQ n=1 Tax=Escherichia coli TaxID=562 RepID=UPI00285299B1|nr:type-F conjugative transfer system pilin chaperone TraQ [Escherichia coli]